MAMQNIFKAKTVESTGFSSRPEFEGARLMNKQGEFNVKKKGLTFFERFSYFHFLITTSWVYFIGLGIIAFIIANILFTSAYFFIDQKEIIGLPPYSSELERFIYLFYFSVQTFTTVGYGSVAPIGKVSGLISSIEALLGLCSFAIMSGILYGRFSKPESRLKYSKNGLIAPFREGKAFMFRLANAKNSDMTEVEARVIFSCLEPNANGSGKIRKFYPMPLDIAKISFLPTSWTVVHVIKDESPMLQLHQEDFINKDIEILVQIMGYDETYNQTVHSRTSYTSKEIIWNATFNNIFSTSEDGIAEVDLSKIDDYTYEK